LFRRVGETKAEPAHLYSHVNPLSAQTPLFSPQPIQENFYGSAGIALATNPSTTIDLIVVGFEFSHGNRTIFLVSLDPSAGCKPVGKNGESFVDWLYVLVLGDPIQKKFSYTLRSALEVAKTIHQIIGILALISIVKGKGL